MNHKDEFTRMQQEDEPLAAIRSKIPASQLAFSAAALLSAQISTPPHDPHRYESSSLSRKTPTERLRLRAARKAERQRKKKNR